MATQTPTAPSTADLLVALTAARSAVNHLGSVSEAVQRARNSLAMAEGLLKENWILTWDDDRKPGSLLVDALKYGDLDTAGLEETLAAVRKAAQGPFGNLIIVELDHLDRALHETCLLLEDGADSFSDEIERRAGEGGEDA